MKVQWSGTFSDLETTFKFLATDIGLRLNEPASSTTSLVVMSAGADDDRGHQEDLPWWRMAWTGISLTAKLVVVPCVWWQYWPVAWWGAGYGSFVEERSDITARIAPVTANDVRYMTWCITTYIEPVKEYKIWGGSRIANVSWDCCYSAYSMDLRNNPLILEFTLVLQSNYVDYEFEIWTKSISADTGTPIRNYYSIN